MDKDDFALGQCHALALALGDALPHVEYIACWLDSRGAEALEDANQDSLIERGPEPDPANTEHIMVLHDGVAIDVSGRTTLEQLDEYCFNAILGWASSDMPLLRYTVVSRKWVEGLARHQAWREPDVESARKVVPEVLGRTRRNQHD